MTPHWLKQTPTGITLNIHCQPGAKQTQVVGLHDGCLKISQKQIQFLSGQNSRKKRIEIWGPITLEQIVQILKP
jgi:uncharacterized protein